jgi:hypothetical protein
VHAYLLDVVAVPHHRERDLEWAHKRVVVFVSPITCERVAEALKLEPSVIDLGVPVAALPIAERALRTYMVSTPPRIPRIVSHTLMTEAKSASLVRSASPKTPLSSRVRVGLPIANTRSTTSTVVWMFAEQVGSAARRIVSMYSQYSMKACVTAGADMSTGMVYEPVNPPLEAIAPYTISG